MIYFLRGISCSGKSTWCNILEEKGVKVLSSDVIAKEYFGIDGPNPPKVFVKMEELGKDFVSKGFDIAVDATNLGYKKSAFWLNLAKEFDVDIVCIYFNLNKKDLMHNIIERQKNRWTSMTVEEVSNIVFGQKKYLKPPTEFEKVISVYRNYTAAEINNLLA